MKIVVFGGGSMGLAYASLLRRVSSDIVLFVRRPEQETAITKGGLKLQIKGKEETTKVLSTSNPIDLSDADVVITLVKNYNSQDAAEIITAYTKDRCLVLVTESGIGVEEIYHNICCGRRIIRAVSYFGAKRVSDTETELGDNMNVTIQRPDFADKIANELIILMQKAGFVVELSDNIQEIVWRKMIAVTAQHAMSALTGMTFGQMLENKDALHLAEELLKEFKAVAEKEEIHLPSDILEIVRNNWKSLPNHKASMYQDLIIGKMTEIEMMNGAIVKLGKRYHIPTPYNDAITNLIRLKQQNQKS
jgi:2-dehydropantoate 2-reductase